MANTTLKIIIGIIVIAIVLWLSAYFLFSRDDRIDDGSTKEPQQAALTGTYICLPHVDTSGPQTLECASGLASGGSNYALNTLALESAFPAGIATGDEISVTGLLVERVDLESNDPLLRYDIAGVLFVTAINRVGTATDTGSGNRQVMTGGDIAFVVPENFGLAVTPDQVLVQGVIPPCSEGFDYCIYYNADTYRDTNLENAGIRMNRRDELTTTTTCITTEPDGYEYLKLATATPDGYVTAALGPLQDAATGHVSEGALYRLYYHDTCYEFETRIGTTQVANYEPGTVTEFTDTKRAQLEEELRSILDTMTIEATGETVQFPQVPEE